MADKHMTLEVNAHSLEWDESSRRVEKKCVHCGMPTKGRARPGRGVIEPAHSDCAIEALMSKALRGAITVKQLAGGE